MSRRVALGLVVIAGCAPEVHYTTLSPELSVLPDGLAFGEVVEDEATATLTVYVDNGGRAALEGTIRIDGDDPAPFSFDPAAAELLLEPDEGTSFEVTFAPSSLGETAAALVFDTNDPDGVFAIAMTGTGRVPYAPDIEVSPASIDFGPVDVGDQETRFFDVKNVGDADLVLGSITQSGAGAFTMDRDYSGTTLLPGQSKPILVTYRAVLGSGDSGEIHLPSNDPDEDEVVVSLEGNGGGNAQYPEAVIDCPGRVDLPGPVDVTLDGRDSSDPNGLALTHAWSIVRRPAAADANGVPVPVDAPVTEVRLDAAGTWEIQLRVTNELLVPSVPEKCVIDAVPVDELHVELSWSGPTADLDLHLAEGAADFFSVPGDTSFCNRRPDWGGPGADDDPSLDLDDDDGFGPENINVRSPAAGTYPVRVHVFDDGDDDAVTATVSVFAFGQLVHTSSQVLNRNEVWEVGQVNWPEGTFGVSTERPWDAEGIRECR